MTKKSDAIKNSRKRESSDKPDINSNVTILPADTDSGLPLVPVDLNGGDIPDLDDAFVSPLELAGNYWTPENPGDSKRLYFDCIKEIEVQSIQEPDTLIPLPCAFFYEVKKGVVTNHCNGSKRLVAILENNHIERGMPILVTYMGKKPNTTNSFKSDHWSVKPLMLKIK